MSEGFDYIVVGGGSSGCVVAGMLSRDPSVTVLLIEAGDRAEDHPETFRADGYKDAFANDALVHERFSVPQEACANKRFFLGTGRGIGGSGAINGMVYTRGAREDYDEWPRGFRYDDLVPAFEAVEQALRVKPRAPTRFTETFIEAAVHAGFQKSDNLNDGNLSGVIGYETMNYEGDERRNSYVAFIRDAGPRPNLRIRTRTRARKVVFTGRRATGVEVDANGVMETLSARREVILCLGALETPKLLLLSGVGPARALKELGIPLVFDAPNVGENLHDHPNVPLFFRGRLPVDVSYPQLYAFHRANGESDLPKAQSDTCYVMYPARSSLREAAMRMLPTKLPSALYGDTSKRLIRGGIALATRFGAAQNFIERTWGVVVILGKPRSRGRIWLRSADPKVEAAIDPAYFAHPEDLDTMVRGVSLARKIANAPALKAWGNDALMPGAEVTREGDIRRFVRENAITTFHFAGTCRMGEDDHAVVDASLRVRGVQGLRVADASVAPVTPVSAMNAPSMMLGYRAALSIERERQSGTRDASASGAPWRA